MIETPVTRPDPVKTRHERFHDMNRWITARGGWVTSLPGSPAITMECLPGSHLVEELREAGYKLTDAGDGERILPHAITAEVITEGSTRHSFRTTHAGIVTVQRFKFTLP